MEAFEELSAEIMVLLQAQLNALDLSTLIDEELRELAKRRARIHQLLAQLGQCRTYVAADQAED